MLLLTHAAGFAALAGLEPLVAVGELYLSAASLPEEGWPIAATFPEAIAAHIAEHDHLKDKEPCYAMVGSELRQTTIRELAFELLLNTVSPAVVTQVIPHMKEAALRAQAYQYFARHPAVAVRGALAAPRKLQSIADEVLGWAISTWPALLTEMPLTDAERARLEALVDPSGLPPSLIATPKHFKKAKPPAFWSPALLPKLQFKDGGAVPDSTPDALRVLLAWVAKTPSTVFPEFQIIRERCTSASRGAFARALLDAWVDDGAQNKEKWALLCAGYLGDDALAEALTPMIRRWPGEGFHKRAELGLAVLELIGTERSIMLLYGISQKVKFKGIQASADETIQAIAKRRGLTTEELGDRLIPSLGLDPDGSMTLDYGPRSFRVGFDEALVPFVTDSAGKQKKSLPKPGASDDAERATPAYKAWGALKKEVKTLAGQQLSRLERAMVWQRHWQPADFEQYFVQHPLVFHLVRRLLWGAYVDGALVAAFRVAEDRTWADAADEAFALPEGAAIGLVHPLHLADRAAWATIFTDYEIVQPFEQLGRATHAAPDVGGRVSGNTVPWGRVLGLEKAGWHRSHAEGGGIVRAMHKGLPGGALATLRFEPGLYIGELAESPEQTLGDVSIDGTPADIGLSELARDLDGLLG